MAKRQAIFKISKHAWGYEIWVRTARGLSVFHSARTYKRRSDAVKAIAWLKHVVLVARLEEDPPKERESVTKAEQPKGDAGGAYGRGKAKR